MITFPGESQEYRAARAELLAQEKQLRRSLEAVAEARRALPAGGIVQQDYVFQQRGPDGAPTDVKMSDLLSPAKEALAIYNLMYSPDMDQPCSGCTSMLDGLDGAAYHVNQRIDFYVVAKSPLPRILEFTDGRWRNLRLLSSAGTTYNEDFHGQSPEGWQQPMMNTFRRDGDAIRHVWGSELLYEDPEPGQHMRHLDTVDSLWSMFDLTHIGRGDFDERLSYEEASR